jgi:hypothetical protein
MLTVPNPYIRFNVAHTQIRQRPNTQPTEPSHLIKRTDTQNQERLTNIHETPKNQADFKSSHVRQQKT